MASKLIKLPLGTIVTVTYSYEVYIRNHGGQNVGEFIEVNGQKFSKKHIVGRDFFCAYGRRAEVVGYGDVGFDHMVLFDCGSVIRFSSGWLKPVSPLQLLAEAVDK